MENKSKLIRGTSKCARFFVCDSTELVKEAKRIHGTDPVATTLFGKLLTVTAMMGKDLKGENDLITLKTNGDGPYGNMLATGNKKGEVKGYVGAIEEEKINGLINENGEFITNEQGQIRFIGDGTLQVIRDMGLKEPFVGLTHIAGEDIADTMVHYFLISEQIKSVVALGVKLSEDGNEVEKAGGYIIQLLPGVDERIIELLYEDISVVEEEAEMSGAHVKKYVEDYEILEESEIEYKCNCTREKYYKGILTLGKEEIEHILKEEGKIEAECHFCGKRYIFTEEDFKDVN